MPEEINRLLTDQISDLLFTPSQEGNENLAREGLAAAKVHLVGNVMIDTLVKIPEAKKEALRDLPEHYVLLTLHRPSNVDDAEWLSKLLRALRSISAEVPVFFLVLPRTRARLAELAFRCSNDGPLNLIDPLP